MLFKSFLFFTSQFIVYRVQLFDFRQTFKMSFYRNTIYSFSQEPIFTIATYNAYDLELKKLGAFLHQHYFL